MLYCASEAPRLIRPSGAAAKSAVLSLAELNWAIRELAGSTEGPANAMEN
jgi:hypothetical protein